MNVIEKIKKLPDDMINLIFEFIPHKKLIFVNSSYYNQYHYLLKSSIPMYENYIRDMIRRDNDFVFEKIIGENINRWLKNKEYRYKIKIWIRYEYYTDNA